MAVVYLPQEPMKRDSKTGQWIQAFDLEPAKKFGDLKVLLPHGSLPIDTKPLISSLKIALDDFKSEDFLLAIGNPTAMVIAGIIASEKAGGEIQMLYWDNKIKDYMSVKFSI